MPMKMLQCALVPDASLPHASGGRVRCLHAQLGGPCEESGIPLSLAVTRWQLSQPASPMGKRKMEFCPRCITRCHWPRGPGMSNKLSGNGVLDRPTGPVECGTTTSDGRNERSRGTRPPDQGVSRGVCSCNRRTKRPCIICTLYRRLRPERRNRELVIVLSGSCQCQWTDARASWRGLAWTGVCNVIQISQALEIWVFRMIAQRSASQA